MDETGFQMGVASAAKVICGSEIRDSHVKSIQPGNREWITIIIAINASGSVLPSHIVFAGKKHQSQWYSAIPKEYRISMSENGWTNDDSGFEWLQEMFEKHTASQTAGRYRPLILDGHSSHATASFDHFCTARKIIPLYMPPHSSHLLRPLDVSCFAPLKHLYGQKTREMIQQNIHSIDKENFLRIYPTVHQPALSSSNIQNGFAATGLIPLSPERVLAKLHIQLKTPTPPSTSHSTQSFGIGKTPAYVQLEQQKQRIQHLQNNQISPTMIDQATQKIIKGAEMTMQNALLLREEVHHLHEENQHQNRRKQRPRAFIQHGGSLTGDEGLQKAQEQEVILQEASQPVSRPRRPPTCSTCGTMGHNRLQCSRR